VVITHPNGDDLKPENIADLGNGWWGIGRGPVLRCASNECVLQRQKDGEPTIVVIADSIDAADEALRHVEFGFSIEKED